ncbi:MULTISPECIES: hypothetical protein [unclassified Mesorhizobium]|uniref:hypothetical protein n=1 Tax=unclassified Mesorhizobium TaxID=325217 RepID=UPI000FCB8700|nr:MULTISPECIES: hypothetical protein [unclassified Mesorhizobium]RUW68438.1 hypothetical protein EOA31_25945 [Mesorhizobium sp. M4B.F.Ca.ET.049.02.1.2]TGV24271.1 hypothetical protein EN786_20820 [Mesorhizobium sp. M4B.F.Ca.ET.143.01.1.1]
MSKAERGPGWIKRDDGKIFYRASRWSPAYAVSQEQFDRLRSLTNSEWVLAWSTISIPAFAFFAWFQGFSTLNTFAYCLVGYCIVNSAYSAVSWRRRQLILRDSTPTSEHVAFLSPSDVISRMLSGLSVWQKRRLLIVVLCVVVGSIISLSQTLFGYSLGSLKPVHPIAASLGLLIFVPMMFLLISHIWFGLFADTSSIEVDRG